MDTNIQKEMKKSRGSMNSEISALRSAIQKNKQVGLDIIREKANKLKAAEAEAKAVAKEAAKEASRAAEASAKAAKIADKAAEASKVASKAADKASKAADKASKAADDAVAETIASEKDLENWEILELKKKLRDVNLENAKNIDRSTLKYPLLYNTREEIMEIMRKDSASINYKGRMDILDQLDHIFHNTKLSYKFEVGRLEYIWYEDPESGDPFDAVYGIHYDGYIETEEAYEDESSPNLYLRISCAGDVVEEYIDDDWLQLSRRHDKLGHITIHAK